MNIVIIDGIINSLIGKVADPRRARARFTVATGTGDEVGVEVRGPGAEKLWAEWEPGDGVHVRGRITAAGFISADYIRRKPANASVPPMTEGHDRMRSHAKLRSARSPSGVQISLGLFPPIEMGAA